MSIIFTVVSYRYSGIVLEFLSLNYFLTNFHSHLYYFKTNEIISAYIKISWKNGHLAYFQQILLGYNLSMISYASTNKQCCICSRIITISVAIRLEKINVYFLLRIVSKIWKKYMSGDFLLKRFFTLLKKRNHRGGVMVFFQV